MSQIVPPPKPQNFPFPLIEDIPRLAERALNNIGWHKIVLRIMIIVGCLLIVVGFLFGSRLDSSLNKATPILLPGFIFYWLISPGYRLPGKLNRLSEDPISGKNGKK